PPFSTAFANALAAARGEFTANRDLYSKVFPILIQEASTGQLDDGYGNLPSNDAGSVDPALQSYKLDATQWAMVLYNLIQQGVRADDPLLTLKAQTALANAVGAGDNAPPSSISIDLPDLEQVADVQIQVANLEAMQAIYFAAMLEELKIFNVVEKLV